MHYTWTNHYPENLIMRKLDRVLVNEKWNLNFPLSEARFLPTGMSDRSPMVVKVTSNDQNIKKPFKFYNVLVVWQTKKASRNWNFSIWLTSLTFQIESKMQKKKWIRLNRLCIQRIRIQLCTCEKEMLYVTTLLPSGLKRVFSNRRQGYNGLAWGIRILATFTNSKWKTK
jgi:hypothetical protein